MSAKPRGRNGVVALAAISVVAAMAGVTWFGAVPLYRAFCQATGYGGTTQRAKAAPAAEGARVITVRFNADIAPNMPWAFQPAQREVKVRLGEEKLIFYAAWNRAGVPVTGTATFNVTPQKAGPYFDKVQCFCFTEQKLEPGQRVEMPVSFFIDPKIAKDRDLDDVTTITLSYTFFPTHQQLGERRD
ncbi:MAG TPA: cytochrome c oxidase assembly protein [Alphaproteobacteria bacterium]|nr:cytochrome c oxidase assembly protein [Alphaproteobacteria bacterium]